ncbi:6908_t:CDS:2 [Ambispora gerdemannii]|uniref:6908_t:CDS:1 n=1 Tax=Ambispora gerdemannii TaxID=144530 RepID=A0A9N9CYK2_9GLOM|nr:6908_t:CDS:2 [Ambispora gerdemannii]
MDKNKEDGGDGEKKNKKIVADSRTETLNQIKVKLKEGHQKLNLEESEIPVSLFAPYKTLADKLNSLNKTEEINALNNNLLIAIEQKKKEKLNAIAQAAIVEIDQAIGDDIERKKNKVKKLIDDQKKADQNDEGIVVDPTGKKTPKTSPQAPKKVSLQKVIGITSLIMILSIIIAVISFRIRQETKARKAKKTKA